MMKYFFYSLYYAFWNFLVVFNLHLTKVVHSIFVPPIAFVLPHKLKIKFIKRQKRLKDKAINDILNYKDGMYIHLFRNSFINVCSIYLSLILLIVSAVLFRITRSFLFSASVGVVCFVVCWIPLNRYVLNDKRYIKYFKEFERKDESWHKKWRRIAVTLIVLQLPVMAIGTLLAFMIVFAGLD